MTHTADLAAVDLTRRDGIPVTSLSRTILDLAVTSRPRTIRRHIQIADDGQLFDRPRAAVPGGRPGGRAVGPAMNHFVAGFEIDAWWEDERFGVELDVDSVRRHLARRSRSER